MFNKFIKRKIILIHILIVDSKFYKSIEIDFNKCSFLKLIVFIIDFNIILNEKNINRRINRRKIFLFF